MVHDYLSYIFSKNDPFVLSILLLYDTEIMLRLNFDVGFHFLGCFIKSFYFAWCKIWITSSMQVWAKVLC